MRVQDDGDRRIAVALRVIPAFETALGAGKDNLGHLCSLYVLVLRGRFS
jgi:hypothetical protein